MYVGFRASGSGLTPGALCEDRVLDGPALGGQVSEGRKSLDCIRGKGVRHDLRLDTRGKWCLAAREMSVRSLRDAVPSGW